MYRAHGTSFFKRAAYSLKTIWGIKLYIVNRGLHSFWGCCAKMKRLWRLLAIPSLVSRNPTSGRTFLLCSNHSAKSSTRQTHALIKSESFSTSAAGLQRVRRSPAVALRHGKADLKGIPSFVDDDETSDDDPPTGPNAADDSRVASAQATTEMERQQIYDFDHLGVNRVLQKKLMALGYETPTDIQAVVCRRTC
jgi:hypothetical protein